MTLQTLLRGDRIVSGLWLSVVLAAVLGGSGCATSGPNHVYATVENSPAVHDLGPPRASITSAVLPGEQVLGLAYDFNTDHLFLRIAPAQVIRVIERPSGKILREMPLPPACLPDNLPTDKVVGTNTGPAALPRSVPKDTAPADIRPDEGRWTDPVRPAGLNRAPRAPSREQQGAGNSATTASADLAIRSSDRHLFAVHPDGRSVVELTLFGEFVRRLELRGLTGPIAGLAYDQNVHQLLVLTASNPARIGAVVPDGNVTYYVTLSAGVTPVSLGYDSDARHFFVPLPDGKTVGEFDAAGVLLARHGVGEDAPVTALDAGPRSFVRVF